MERPKNGFGDMFIRQRLAGFGRERYKQTDTGTLTTKKR